MYHEIEPGFPASHPVLVNLADVPPEPVHWLWPGRIPLGKLTLLVGEPAVGKSLLALNVAARVSAGTPWPDSPDTPNPPGNVVLLCGQDSLADTVRPRLDAAGADQSRISAITSVRRSIVACGPLPLGAARLLPSLAHLDWAIPRIGQCRLVIIDPITRYFDHSSHSPDDDTRVVLEPLADLAARHHVALLAVHQAPRTTRGFKVQKSVGRLSPGSARTVWALVPDAQNPLTRLLVPLKNTMAAETPPLACGIRQEPQHQAPSIAWHDRPLAISSQDILDHRTTREDRIDARNWLLENLQAGPVPAALLLDQARQNGLAPKTIRRAGQDLGLIRARKGIGRHATWLWALPGHENRIDEYILDPSPDS